MLWLQLWTAAIIPTNHQVSLSSLRSLPRSLKSFFGTNKKKIWKLHDAFFVIVICSSTDLLCLCIASREGYINSGTVSWSTPGVGNSRSGLNCQCENTLILDQVSWGLFGPGLTVHRSLPYQVNFYTLISGRFSKGLDPIWHRRPLVGTLEGLHLPACLEQHLLEDPGLTARRWMVGCCVSSSTVCIVAVLAPPEASQGVSVREEDIVVY